jgi:hypothetical protein
MTDSAARGFGKDSMVKATKTLRVPNIDGNKIKIKANSVGIPDSSIVDENGNQLVHFEVGGLTPCVSYPAEALLPA